MAPVLRDFYPDLAAIEAPAAATLEVIDRYVGKPLAAGEAALTVRITLFPSEKTLTDEQIDGYRRELMRCISEDLKLQLRG